MNNKCRCGGEMRHHHYTLVHEGGKKRVISFTWYCVKCHKTVTQRTRQSKKS